MGDLLVQAIIIWVYRMLAVNCKFIFSLFSCWFTFETNCKLFELQGKSVYIELSHFVLQCSCSDWVP